MRTETSQIKTQFRDVEVERRTQVDTRHLSNDYATSKRICDTPKGIEALTTSTAFFF